MYRRLPQPPPITLSFLLAACQYPESLRRGPVGALRSGCSPERAFNARGGTSLLPGMVATRRPLRKRFLLIVPRPSGSRTVAYEQEPQASETDEPTSRPQVYAILSFVPSRGQQCMRSGTS